MILKDFIKEYVEGNSLVRVLYKNPGGHKLVLDDWNDVAMDWEIVRGQGKYASYVNHKVLCVASILVRGPYSEAVNVVIEEIPLDELRENKLKSLL
jgi:hypothetical protein